MWCPPNGRKLFLDLCFPPQCQCDSQLENTKAHVSLSQRSLSDHLFIHEEAQHYRWNKKMKKTFIRINVCPANVWVRWSFLPRGWWEFFFVCFPIQQFNEKLKDQTGNPWQQPRNPRFVMLSMLHCKQIQAAYQGSKHRKDLLSCARSSPLRT